MQCFWQKVRGFSKYFQCHYNKKNIILQKSIIICPMISVRN